MVETVTSVDLEVGATSVRVQQAGDGDTPVLFLHGAGGVPAWTPFFSSLAAGRRLFVPDHPGFGLSPDADHLRDMSDYAMFYLDLLDALDVADVHVVGHSLGGWLAAEMAIRNENRVRSWSLIAPAGIRLRGKPMADIFIWSQEEGIRNLFQDQRLADQLLAQEPTPEQLDVMLRNRYTFAKLAWQPRGFNPALAKWLHRVTRPTTIVWGRNDQLLDYAYADLWRDHIPHATVELLDECGHLPIVEQAEATASHIAAHIDAAGDHASNETSSAPGAATGKRGRP
ncbi:MAG: alpha/beta fold hydrolase [Acidimicrobiales bacterium]